jgi:hypothetical protein
VNAQQVYAEVGASGDVVHAMLRAERYGQAMAHGATIIFTGYADGTPECSAATAQYAVRW